MCSQSPHAAIATCTSGMVRPYLVLCDLLPDHFLAMASYPPAQLRHHDHVRQALPYTILPTIRSQALCGHMGTYTTCGHPLFDGPAV